MSADRRISERHARRVEVRFWRAGSTQPHSGFTTNVSTTGLFLGTTQALEPGERLRVELIDRGGGFVVEAQVARVHRVSIALRHLEQPGAGIRFLTPAELVAALIPAARQTTGGAARQRQAERTVTGSPGASAGEAPAPTVAAVAGSTPPARQEGAPAPTPPVVVVEFADRTGFLTVYHRDLSAGSLHVSSEVPACLDDTVLVEIRPPLPDRAPLRFEATVVHRFEPRAAVGKGSNMLAGMGVRFRDPEQVRAALAPILAELRR